MPPSTTGIVAGALPRELVEHQLRASSTCEPERTESPSTIASSSTADCTISAGSGGCRRRRRRSRRGGPRPRSSRRRSSGRRGRACRRRCAAVRRARRPRRATRARTASTRSPSRPSCWPSTPVAGRYSPNTSRSVAGPLAGGDARQGALDRRPIRFCAARRGVPQLAQRGIDLGLARGARFVARSISSVSAADSGSTRKMPPSSPPSSGDGKPVGPLVEADDDLSPALMRASRSAWRATSAAFM